MLILQLNDTHKGFDHNTDSIHRKFFKEVAAQEFDVLVHAGDMASVKQASVKASMLQLRKAAGNRPVCLVRGNHDYWQGAGEHRRVSHNIMLRRQRQWAADLNIILLDEGGTYETDNVFIGGFASWYGTSPVGLTNDFKWMERLTPQLDDVDSVLRNCETFTLTNLMYQLEGKVGKTRIVVSHMPIFGTSYDQKYTSSFSNQHALRGNCEHYLCGHSHRHYEGSEEMGWGIKVWQTGSDYNKPRFQIIDTAVSNTGG